VTSEDFNEERELANLLEPHFERARAVVEMDEDATGA
jgi:hypothetical protein